MPERFIAYYRVSTRKQGDSGLGLEAQREAVRRFIGDGQLLAEFEEVESGKRSDRPALEAALKECRLRRAKLIIAKLDRLSRSVAFVSRLMEEQVDFVAVDMPHSNRFTIHVMAALAEQERELISARTRAALQAAKARGVSLGGRRGSFRIEDVGEKGRARSLEVRATAAQLCAQERLEAVRSIGTEGIISLHGVARELNARSIPAPRGGTWSAGQVRRLLAQAKVRVQTGFTLIATGPRVLNQR